MCSVWEEERPRAWPSSLSPGLGCECLGEVTAWTQQERTRAWPSKGRPLQEVEHRLTPCFYFLL